MKNIIFTGLCLFFMLSFKTASAQLPKEPVNFQSPNAFQLNRHVGMPVNNFTGVPNIDIPLYTLSEKGLNVPLVLNYDASGFRPDEHPGWVGMNFSLSAGGVITRSVNNLPDEFQTFNENGLNNQNGYYFLRGSSIFASWETAVSLVNAANSSLNPDGDPLPAGGFDLAPDEFAFSFPGYSGKFYLDQDGSWKVQCDRPVKVEFDNTFLYVPMATSMLHRLVGGQRNFKSFSGFTVISEDGTRYKFGGTTNSIEYSIGFLTQNREHWIANSWYLTKITSATGDVVDFTYQPESRVNSDGETEYGYINQMYVSIGFDVSLTTPTNNCNLQVLASEDIFHGKLIRPVYLSEINGKNIKLKFSRSTTTELRYSDSKYTYNFNYIYSPWRQGLSDAGAIEFQPYSGYAGLQWKKLDQITVEQNGTVLKKIVFEYDNSASERLRLKKVVEYGKSTDLKQTHEFGYDNSKELPPYLAGQTDHWGFFNGRNSLTGNIFVYAGQAAYYASRQPQEEFMYAGVMNKITYPTGGYTELVYEPNFYGQVVTGKRSDPPTVVSKTMAGGLRIKKTITMDPQRPQEKIEKEYFYVSGYNAQLSTSDLQLLPSSGVLGGQPKYLLNIRWQITPNAYATRQTFSSQSLYPGSTNSFGSHIGYTQVVERNSNGSYIKYTYSNFDNGRVDADAQASLSDMYSSDIEYQPNSSAGVERGKLLNQDEYSNTDLLLKSKQVDYLALNKATSFVKSIDAEKSYLECGQVTFYYRGISYRLNTYSYLPIKETVYLFDSFGNNPVTKIVDYSYNDDKLVIEKKYLDSRRDENKTLIRYPRELVNSNRDSFGVYAGMVSSNMVGVPIENIEIKGAEQVGLSLTNYGLISGYYLPISVQLQKDISSPLETRVQYTKYDASGNLLSMLTDGYQKSSFIWGYGGIYPIAKVTNSDYSTLEQALGGASAIGAFNDILNPTLVEVKRFLEPLRTSIAFNDAQVSSFIYKPYVGVIQQIDQKGLQTSYEYDIFQRLYCIRDHNGDLVKTFCYNYAGQNVNCEQLRDIDTTPQWEDTGEKRCALSGGLFTGVQLAVQKDMNPDSQTYNTTRTVSLGINTSVCTLPTVYAKIIYSNERHVNNPNNDSENVYADISIALYADAALSIPYVTGVSRNINYKIMEVYNHDFGIGGDFENENRVTTTNHIALVLAGNGIVVIPNALVHSFSSNVDYIGWTDLFDTDYNYELLIGQGYIIP